MSKTERVMLYAVALIVGGMLVLDRGATEPKLTTTSPKEQLDPDRQPNIDRPQSNAATVTPRTVATEKSPDVPFAPGFIKSSPSVG